MKRQCELLDLCRSSFYARPEADSRKKVETVFEQALHAIHEAYPFYGYRKAVHELRRYGVSVSEWQVRTARNTLGIRAIYPGPQDKHCKQRT